MAEMWWKCGAEMNNVKMRRLIVRVGIDASAL